MRASTLTSGAWIVGGMAFLGFSDNLIPLVSEEMGLWQFHVVRSLLMIPAILVWAWLAGVAVSLLARDPRRVAERTAWNAVALLLYFAALPAVGIAVAAAGLFTAPLWVVALSALVWRERIGPRRWAAAGIGFLGVCVVLGVGRAPVEPMAAAALAAGAAYAMNVIWTRRYCAGEASLALTFWQFGAFLIAGAIGLAAQPWLAEGLAGVPGTRFAWQGWVAFGWAEFGLIVAIGAGAVVGATLIATGYRQGESSRVAVFDFSFLVWGPLWAWLMFAEPIAWTTVAGMILIAGAGALAVGGGEPARAEPEPAR